MTTGITIKDRIVVSAGLLLNLAGILCFFIEWEYHPLVNAIASLFGILLPGIYLWNQSKKQKLV